MVTLILKLRRYLCAMNVSFKKYKLKSMGWSKPVYVGTVERSEILVKRETIWTPKSSLLHNKPPVIRPEMSPVVGPMLKDLSGNVIIYDYFIRSGIFYMISTYWTNLSPKLTVFINDNLAEENGYQEYMPSRHFSSKVGNTGLVWVTINGVDYELMPEIIKPLQKKHKLGIILNFKHERPDWIRRFLNYYSSQGADAFYFYYNGPIMPHDLPLHGDIWYKQWDCKFKILTNRFIHSAQTAAYCSFRYRYYDDCEWVAIIDLDEFICELNENSKLVDILKKSKSDVIMIDNYWASVGPEGGPIKYSLKSCGFAYDNGRTKCIYNTQRYRNEWSIHWPKGDCKMIKSKQLCFFHIVDCLHPERTNMLLEPTAYTKRVRLTKL